jgi:hypothetical protein
MIQWHKVLEKSLPSYEDVCLKWFNNEYSTKEEEKHPKPDNSKVKAEDQKQGDIGIYSSAKYQNALEAYRDELFPRE